MAPTLLDTYRDHKTLTEIGSRLIQHLFQCTETPSDRMECPQLDLDRFILHVIHSSGLPPDTVYLALFFLQRLKHRGYLLGQEETGHHLFLTAFMLATKCVHDRPIFNRSWEKLRIIPWSLQKINRMERDMCAHLGWDMDIDPELLLCFSESIAIDFSPYSTSLYPTYTLSVTSRAAAAEEKAAKMGYAATARTPERGKENARVVSCKRSYYQATVTLDFQMAEQKAHPPLAHIHVFTVVLPSRW
jgi:hypothetical protein